MEITVPYVTYLVTKGAMSVTPVVAPPSEFPVLVEIYEEGNVREAPSEPAYIGKTCTLDPYKEYDRLAHKYGKKPDTETAWVSLVFGHKTEGRLQRYLEQHAVSEDAQQNQDEQAAGETGDHDGSVEIVGVQSREELTRDLDKDRNGYVKKDELAAWLAKQGIALPDDLGKVSRDALVSAQEQLVRLTTELAVEVPADLTLAGLADYHDKTVASLSGQ